MEFQRAFSTMRAIDSTWRALKAYPAPLLVGGLLLVFTSGGAPLELDPGGLLPGASVELDPGEQFSGSGEWGTFLYDWTVKGTTPQALLISVAAGLLRCLLLLGFAGVMEAALSRGTPRVAQVFAARGGYWRMLQALVLQALLGLAAIAPLVAWAWPMSAGSPEDLDPVGGVLMVVGVVAAIAQLALFESYPRLVRSEQEQVGW